MDELTVLVTGSSRGIGRAAAIRLAREGYTVVVHGRTMSDALKATLSEVQALSPASRALTFDVSDREAARAAVSEDVEAHGAYYGLVLNAGINADGTFAAMPAEDWDRVIAVDLGSFYNVVQPLVMPMVHRRKPGRIVVMSSVAGVIGNRGQVNYSAAKAGLIGAVKALALELASRAITVNAVAPGLIETEMVTEEILERVKPFIPMRRAGLPDEWYPECLPMRKDINVDILGFVHACHNRSSVIGRVTDSFETLLAACDAYIRRGIAAKPECDACDVKALCRHGCPLNPMSRGQRICCEAEKLYWHESVRTVNDARMLGLSYRQQKK